VLESAARDAFERRPVVAIKIGGSLLSEPMLIDRLQWLVAQRPHAKIFCVCGGGAAADTVRDWQAMHEIADLAAHRLAVAAMDFNARLLESALPDCRLVASGDELDQAWTDGCCPVISTERFLEVMDIPGVKPLPVGWHVTSDSIAVALAHRLDAAELVLAKSTDLEPQTSLEAARRAGLVDPHFGTSWLPEAVSWTNLREESPAIVSWLSQPAESQTLHR
jgi:5-(aminomethyl)-3-furanmethanol phosphate kinase